MNEITIKFFNPTADVNRWLADGYVNGERVVFGSGRYGFGRRDAIREAVEELFGYPFPCNEGTINAKMRNL